MERGDLECLHHGVQPRAECAERLADLRGVGSGKDHFKHRSLDGMKQSSKHTSIRVDGNIGWELPGCLGISISKRRILGLALLIDLITCTTGSPLL